MTDKPRRPWFQLHLSTAIVMMFVAGGLMWANLQPTRSKQQGALQTSKSYGWPWIVRVEFEPSLPIAEIDIDSGVNQSVLIAYANRIIEEDNKRAEDERRWRNWSKNIAIAIAVVLFSSFVSESFYRRREARAP